MEIIFFFATKLECEELLREISNKQEFSLKGIPLIKGKLKNKDILLCISGIGKINASIASVLIFEKFPISKAIVGGVGGAYPSSGLKIGEIVVAEREIDADEGLLIECSDHESSFLFFNKEEINLHIPSCWKNQKKGTFLTVSACTGNTKRAKFLEKKFNAICENMEGAAIAKAGQFYNIAVTEIRSISNEVKDRTQLLTNEEVKSTASILQQIIIDSINSLD